MGAMERSAEEIRTRIANACDRTGRADDIRIVAAAKGMAAEAVARAVAAGIVDVGENYVAELADLRPQLPQARWHFIGTLQSHTAHRVAELADVVQTLSSDRAASRLARRAAAGGRTLDALIEVDFTERRAGVAVDALDAYADRVASLAGIRLCGLMTLPPPPARAEDARPYFRRLRSVAERLRERHPGVIELSMGMSLDYEVAVEEGATMVRIGTALFGPRRPPT
jgi:PLP dependent protein